MSETIASQIGLLEMPSGASSMAILAAKLGLPPIPYNYPYDPSDLGRCLRAHGDNPPEMMRGVHRVWDLYLDRWGELVDLYYNENEGTKHPRLYQLMNELQKQARQ